MIALPLEWQKKRRTEKGKSLRNILKRTFHKGRDMSGRFMTAKDVSAAKYETEVYNSKVKRGEIKPEKYVRDQHVVCGCGAEGCIFITHWPRPEAPR